MRQISKFRIPAFVLGALAAGAMAFGAAAAPPKGAPKALKVAFVDFFSGGAAVFGVSGKGTSEWLVAKWNKEGGIGGVPIDLVLVDEGGGPKKQVSELRRLVLDEKVDAVVGYTSSGNCLAIAPVAEELKVLTVVHVCGTHRLTEDNKLKYVFRTAANQAGDSVSLARYALSVNPDIKTIAGANEDYAWGRDSWEAFKIAMQRLKPDVKVVAELWTKFQAGEYSAEISRLLAARPRRRPLQLLGRRADHLHQAGAAARAVRPEPGAAQHRRAGAAECRQVDARRRGRGAARDRRVLRPQGDQGTPGFRRRGLRAQQALSRLPRLPHLPGVVGVEGRLREGDRGWPGAGPPPRRSSRPSKT